MLRHCAYPREHRDRDRDSFNGTEARTGARSLFHLLVPLHSLSPSSGIPRSADENGVRFSHLHINHRPDGLKKPAGYNRATVHPPITAKHRLRFPPEVPLKNSSHMTAGPLRMVGRPKRKKGRTLKTARRICGTDFLYRSRNMFYL